MLGAACREATQSRVSSVQHLGDAVSMATGKLADAFGLISLSLPPPSRPCPPFLLELSEAGACELHCRAPPIAYNSKELPESEREPTNRAMLVACALAYVFWRPLSQGLEPE